jgi:hypothetical protein
VARRETRTWKSTVQRAAKSKKDGFNQIQQRWLFGPPALKIPEVVLQIGLSRKQRKAELAVAKALIALLF